MCEAQHHAIWENKLGELVDITPNAFCFSSTLFIPDDRIVYDGRNIDSVRMNVTDNAVIDDFLSITEIRETILANAQRTQENKVILEGIVSCLYNKYQNLGKEVILFALAGNGPSSNCFCNSGKAYQECHGSRLQEMLGVPASSDRDPLILCVFGQKTRQRRRRLWNTNRRERPFAYGEDVRSRFQRGDGIQRIARRRIESSIRRLLIGVLWQ